MVSVFSRNIMLKVISIFLALMLWFVAIREHNPEITRRFDGIPVTLVNEEQLEPKGFTLSERNDKNITIQLRGRAHDFVGINSEDITGIVDLSTVTRTGEQYLTVELRGLPSGLQIQRSPELAVSIESMKSKIIPITFNFDLEPANGYSAESFTVTPSESIRVTGPSSILDTIESAEVTLVESDLRQSLERSLPIRLYDSEDRQVQTDTILTNPDYVIVSLPVYPTKSLVIRATVSGRPAHGFEMASVDVFPREIVVRGDESILTTIQDISTEIIDIEGTTSDIRRNLRLNNYIGINVLEGQPVNVNVMIRIQEIITVRQLDIDYINILNRPENGRIRVEPESIRVLLQGPQLTVDNLVEEDISISIDLEGLTRGEHTVPLQILIPDNLELIEVSEESVTVTIN